MTAHNTASVKRRLHVAPRPCNTCPYATSTPAGIWHPDEYEKLPRYDTNASLATFLCHQSATTGASTACRGWLSVHRESVAARLAVLRGEVTDDERYAPDLVPLYASGQEARGAGLAGVAEPDTRARGAIDRLVQKGIGRVPSMTSGGEGFRGSDPEPPGLR